MVSPFDAAMRAGDRTLMRIGGETVRIEPRIENQFRGSVADPARPIVEVQGSFTVRSDLDRLQGVRKGTELNGMTQALLAPARIWFSYHEYAKIGYVLEKGDVVRLIKRDGEPRYEVLASTPTEVGDVTIPLVATT